MEIKIFKLLWKDLLLLFLQQIRVLIIKYILYTWINYFLEIVYKVVFSKKLDMFPCYTQIHTHCFSHFIYCIFVKMYYKKVNIIISLLLFKILVYYSIFSLSKKWKLCFIKT